MVDGFAGTSSGEPIARHFASSFGVRNVTFASWPVTVRLGASFARACQVSWVVATVAANGALRRFILSAVGRVRTGSKVRWRVYQ
ncbi:hypothetical protein AB0M50_09015 [Nonomuraea fuscirosea]|uniref:hypothetical protein n=1 Tax=Nonomuraea fuscirosea TaxID=1291556 RepID=UPI003444A0DC